MEVEHKTAIFAGDSSPGIVMLDVQGRKNPVLSPDLAIDAINLADALQDIGGTGRMTSHVPVDCIDEDPEDVVLVYYRSHSGRPRKSEIARVARAIATSAIRDMDDEDSDAPLYVTGTRAVVYAERMASDANTAAFLCSTTVWYNHNRSVVGWPATKSQIEMFLDDINGRLSEGQVTIAR
ncbi:hypothetical protein [Pseudosulfitobacter pseudonitzschiae]|uniref:hypothetical protein n=1 Tax=Pseudosulfitobacter pseudonitzschiae TaxID=1402135 RepID=UPI003B783BF0